MNKAKRAGVRRKAPLGQPTAAKRRGSSVRAALAVFAVALLVRLIHLWQLRSAPFFDLLVGDSAGYDRWAQEIAAGEWIGRETFYQAPLYPYFLGVLYATLGRDLLVVRAVQALIGAASCALVVVIGARLFSRDSAVASAKAGGSVGIVAGLMLAFYAPAIFTDALIQKSVLDVFFLCAVLWLLVGLVDDPRPLARWGWVGVSLGALSLTRENALVLVAAVLLWAWIQHRQSGMRRLHLGAALVAGLLAVLLPVAIRNNIVGGEFLLTTSQLGPNFYIGNNPHADGAYRALEFGRGDPEYERADATRLAEKAVGRTLSPGEVSAYWFRQALGYIRSQPVDWLRLMARKAALTGNAVEVIDTESQYTHQQWSQVLRLTGTVGHFGVILPLAVLGIGLTWGERRRVWLIQVMAVMYAASVIAFYVFTRYRYPLVAFLLPFAAAGCVYAPELLRPTPAPQPSPPAPAAAAPGPPARQPRWGGTSESAPAARAGVRPRSNTEDAARSSLARGGGAPRALREAERQPEGRVRGSSRLRLMRYAAAVVGVALFANWPLLSKDGMRAITHMNFGTALREAGRYQEAIAEYEAALRLDPEFAAALSNYASALSASGRIDEAILQYERALAKQPDVALVHYNLANALAARQRFDDAVRHYRLALELTPDDPEMHNNLGMALASAGKSEEAVAALREANRLDPTGPLPLNNLALLAQERGQLAEAIDLYQQALRLDPRFADAHRNLGTALMASGQPERAGEHLRRALELNPNDAEAHDGMGVVFGATGELAQAEHHFREALSIDASFVEAREHLAVLFAEQGREQEARAVREGKRP